jgi:polyketide biosynthesis enoyl-CoA hydratase PksH
MGIVSDALAYETLQVRFQDEVCFVRIHRPEANNTINDRLIEELAAVLDLCDAHASVVVLEGLPHVFCFGADFKGIQERFASGAPYEALDPKPMYRVWLRLALGPYVTIAHVRGQANAGGIGFVAACDVVICDESATFGLSELLFGLMPACVMPFLVRRMGFAKANYMTLITEPVSAQNAREWGLVDEVAPDSQNLLRKKLLRLRRLSKTAVRRYKRYVGALDDSHAAAEQKALDANMEVFSDTANVAKIARYVSTGQFPWEGER